MDNIADRATKLLDNADIFLGLAGSSDAVEELRQITKSLYDMRMKTGSAKLRTKNPDILPQLCVDKFDNEQIFQQIELLNAHSIDAHRLRIAQLKAKYKDEPKPEQPVKKSKSKDKSEKSKMKTICAEEDSKKPTKIVPSLVDDSESDEDTRPKLNKSKKSKKESVESLKASASKSGKKRVSFAMEDDEDEDETKSSKLEKRNVGARKRQGKMVDQDDDVEPDDEEESEESEEEKELKMLLEKVAPTNKKKPSADNSKDYGLAPGDDDDEFDDDDEDDDDDDDDDDKEDKSSDDSDAEDDSAVTKLKAKLRAMNEAKAKPRGKSSVVDDRFFKLSEMEAFLDDQDKREMRGELDKNVDSDDEDEDLSADDQAPYMYSDFFDPPEDAKNVKKVKKQDNDDDDDDEVEAAEGAASDEDEAESSDADSEAGEEQMQVDVGDDKDDDEEGDDDDDEWEDDDSNEAEDDGKKKDSSENAPGAVQKSSFELRQEKLKKQISELEQANLKPKKWQLTGEVMAAARPENSLLQENIDFEFMTRQAPVITEATTNKLEDLIIQRIKDKAWDDVERKARPTDKMVTYSKRVVLDQERSKQSLSQIYEQQFLKLAEKSAEGEKEDPKHVEVKSIMQSLFIKLDALANFHYTPKPVVQDVKIVSNVPALSLEEAIPAAVSDAALLAPQEVEAKRRGELVGTTEMSDVDRHRARRAKKRLQRARAKKRQLKEKEKLAAATLSDSKRPRSEASAKSLIAAALASAEASGGRVQRAEQGKRGVKRGRMKDMMAGTAAGGDAGKKSKMPVPMEKKKKLRTTPVSPSPKVKKSNKTAR